MTDARPKIAYIYAIVPDSANPRLTQMADEFTQSVAQYLRVLLKAHDDTLPAGEPLIGWRGVKQQGVLAVSASRQASPVFNLLSSTQNDSIADTLLLRAARSAQDQGDGIFWSSDETSDSLAFSIGFALSPQGKIELGGSYRSAFPVFSVLSPPETPALFIGTSHPVYPLTTLQLGATGVVIVQFKVDTAGHVLPETVREQWPSSTPRPTGDLLIAYTAFLQSVMTWLPTAAFKPARIGSCPVNQLVEQPFTFDFR